MVRRVSFGAAIVAAALVLAGCAPGVQPLLDEYNALFGSVTLADDGTDKTDHKNVFTLDQYELSLTSKPDLSLHIGWHNASCQWDLQPDPGFPDTKLPAGFNINDHLNDNNTYLALNVKEAGFQAGTRYILTCTVSKGGETLTDKCMILVVE